MYLVTSEQMRDFDNHTISTLRVPGIVLMEHAGKEVASEVVRWQPGSVIVFCGKGNNGGDGWIAARWLKLFGVLQVQVVSLVEPAALRGDAAIAAEMAISANVPYTVHQSGAAIPTADVYIDALLGTGSNRPLSAALRELVEAMNAGRCRVLAVDVPTGVDASTGEVPDLAVRAEVTLCMACQKLGTAVSPGCYFAGEVKVAEIGIRCTEGDTLAELITSEQIASWLPARSPDSHKGRFGRVGIVIGRMSGAAVLAGLGAARSGAGLVVLGHSDDAEPHAPYEFVVRKVGQEDAPTNLFHDCSTVVLGPGLGRGSPMWREILVRHAGNGVIDADGLAYLADQALTLENADRWVLTPHPKECARLLGWSTEQVQAHRIEAARALAQQTGAIVVLKGFRSIVVNPSGQIRVIPTGDASLATAGTGDVLAGIVGGLLAQGLTPFDAAAAGAWIHGRAGELAGRSRSKISTIASDVVDFISRAILLHFDTIPGENGC